MSPSTPQGLLYNVWTLYSCRRGREGQRNLTKCSFVFLQDENGKQYATMAHIETSNTRQLRRASDNTITFGKLGRMYQTEHLNDAYNALSVYLEKLNPQCSSFFQSPKRI